MVINPQSQSQIHTHEEERIRRSTSKNGSCSFSKRMLRNIPRYNLARRHCRSRYAATFQRSDLIRYSHSQPPSCAPKCCMNSPTWDMCCVKNTKRIYCQANIVIYKGCTNQPKLEVRNRWQFLIGLCLRKVTETIARCRFQEFGKQVCFQQRLSEVRQVSHCGMHHAS